MALLVGNILSWLRNGMLLIAPLIVMGQANITHDPAVNTTMRYGPPAMLDYGPKLPRVVNVPVLSSRGGEIPQTWTITAYTAGYESTQKKPGEPGYGLAANGEPIQQGECACDKRFPFGTKFDISGIGVVVCTDRGGAITGDHLDLYMTSVDAALRFGKQHLEVTIIK